MNRFEAMRNALLAALAWAGLLLYILACASWSPDGSTLLYPYHNPKTGESGVAIYERGSDTVRVLYASDEQLTPTQWEREGKRAVLFIAEEELLVYPLDDSGPLRRLKLPVSFENAPWFPVPEVDGKLFLLGDSLARIDLRSGETFVQEAAITGDVILFQGKEKVHYARALEEGVEIGTLDLTSLELRSAFSLSEQSLKDRGIDQVAFFACDPRSERIAAVSGGDGINAVLLLGPSGLERVVVPRTTETEYLLGNLQWSPDGTRVFASMASPRDEGDSTQSFIAEVSLDDGATRVLPVARLTENWSSDSSFLLLLQLALSPDGNLLAVSTAALGDDDVALEDRGLYLVDLRDFGSYVTFIPLPEASGKTEPREGS